MDEKVIPVVTTEKKKVINVENVMKSFRIGHQDVQVLKGISFHVDQGDFAIIIGPSGSGKSTLLHTILGLEIPTSGKVWFLDQDLYALETEDDRSIFRKKHIGMVYQQPNWIKSLTVVENVAFPLSLMGISKIDALPRAWKALQELNMLDWVNYKPTELSGGQQQKVALVRALVNNPEVIIADEPTGNLDFASGQMLMELLVSLNQKGITIVMVTHDLEYVKYAKTIVEFLDGKVVNVYDSATKDKATFAMQGKRGGGESAVEKSVQEKTEAPKVEPTANVKVEEPKVESTAYVKVEESKVVPTSNLQTEVIKTEQPLSIEKAETVAQAPVVAAISVPKVSVVNTEVPVVTTKAPVITTEAIVSAKQEELNLIPNSGPKKTKKATMFKMKETVVK